MENTPLKRVLDHYRIKVKDLAQTLEVDPGNLSRVTRGQIPSHDLAPKICAQFPGILSELHLFYPERYPDFQISDAGAEQRGQAEQPAA